MLQLVGLVSNRGGQVAHKRRVLAALPWRTEVGDDVRGGELDTGVVALAP